jgi:hypothetical protein
MSDVYPNETYPAETSVALLDGTTDQGTGLAYIAKGVGPASQPSYEIQYNRRQQRQNLRLAVITEGMVVDEGALKIGVYPFNYTLGGLHKRFAGATNQGVPDNATRYVYVDSSNSLQIADAYPADISAFVPLAKVIAAGGAVTMESHIGRARVVVGPQIRRIGTTVGAESSNTIHVTLQLEDQSGQAVSCPWLAEIWLSGSAYGDLVATAPSGGLSVAVGQQLGAHLVSNKYLKVVSSSEGTIALDITDSGSPTFYVMAVGGGADLVAGGPVAFAQQ